MAEQQIFQLLGFFFQPFLFVFEGTLSFVRDDARGSWHDAGIAGGSPGLHAGIQNFLLAPLSHFNRSSCGCTRQRILEQ